MSAEFKKNGIIQAGSFSDCYNEVTINNDYLPNEYQRVEYLEGNSGTAIDSGDKFNPEVDRFEILAQGTIANHNGMIYASSGSYYTWLYHYGSSTRMYINDGSQRNVPGIPTDTEQHLYCLKDKTYIVDGDVIGDFKAYTLHETGTNMYFFDYGASGTSYPYKGRIFDAKIWRNNTLNHHFIPCYRKSDGKPGLYDIVSNTFKTNSGTGEFLLGPSVGLPNIYQQVEYLQSTGVQYIKTDIKPFSNTKYQFFADYTTGSTSLFGSSNSNSNWSGVFYANQLYIGSTGGQSINYANNKLTEIVIDDTNKKAYVNGLTLNYSGTTQNNSNIGLFGQWFGNNIIQMCSAKLFLFRIFNSMEIALDLVPCYRKIDGKPGMYDTVTGKFYTNKGTGTDFLLGPSVGLPERYRQVEYISTHNTNGTIHISTSDNNVIVSGISRYDAINGNCDAAFGRVSTGNPRVYYYDNGLIYGPTPKYGSWTVGTQCYYIANGADTTDLLLLGMYSSQNTSITTWFFRVQDEYITHDYTPAYDTIDKCYGFYDMVTGTFNYGNSGKNTFTAGPFMGNSVTGIRTETECFNIIEN